MSLAEALPITAINAVSDLPKVRTGRLEWDSNPAVERHRQYQCATMPHMVAQYFCSFSRPERLAPLNMSYKVDFCACYWPCWLTDSLQRRFNT